MAQQTNTIRPPLVAIAVRDRGSSERLALELGTRVPGAMTSILDDDRALREAIALDPARRADAFLVDPASATLLSALSEPDDAIVAGVVFDPAAGGAALPPDPRFAGLPKGPEPSPFAEASAWAAGAVAAVSKACADESAREAYGRRYEDLVEALPDIVYELDIDGVITFVNESVAMLGYAPADLIGKHYSVLLHDDDAAAVDRDRVLPDFLGYRTGLALSPKLFNERRGIERRTTDLEVRLKRNPGASGASRELIGSVISYGEVSSAGEYARDEDKEFKGSVGIIRDVTLRRKSEEMLRKLYQAVDQLGSCVFVLNHAFEVEYVNPAFFMLTGFAPPDVIGRSVFRFFAFMPDKVDKISKRVQDGFEAKEEALVPRSTGGQFWATFSMAPVRSPSGAITHAIVIVEDVSARKSMEELLRNARRDAEDASRDKSRFLSGMTQELREPILGIVAAAKLLPPGAEGVKENAEAILENAQFLIDSLTGVLDYVRSESSEGPIQRLAFPVGPFMERACGRFKIAAAAKGLGFSLRVENREIIESDPDRLGRVVEILIEDAVRTTRVGELEVRASIERRAGNVPHLVVSVAGVGQGAEGGPAVGIQRADGPSRGGSRGIGLALAHNIVKVLGGEIRRDVSAESGASYTVVVPAAAPVKEPRPVMARYSLLVVDDNEVNLEYMRTLVENCGYRVHAAQSAQEAFRVLETRYVDAALLDIQMPGYSGVELAKAIRAYAGPRYSPSMPLFAMTAQDPGSVEGADTLFACVFPKPTDIRKFSAALNEAMMERETVSLGELASGLGFKATVARIKLDVESATSALSLALSGTSDARVDIRAEASALTSVFQRFSCKVGVETVRLFIEHYADEDTSVLAGLLERIGRMLQAGIAAAGKVPGGPS
ncbi:MAG: PAS domain S-box protein [Spirochaetes bacterium]|nr:PAS domain S-box protein [Spirochaetota bacterium]